MRAWDELVERCARKRRAQLGSLSDEAYDELVLAVRENPVAFVDDDAEQAFLEVAQALDAYEASRHDDDLLDDVEFRAAREKRLALLANRCNHAATVDAGCIDARLLGVLARDLTPDPLLEHLMALRSEMGVDLKPCPVGGTDPWDNPFCRPQLRLTAAIARTCAESARFRMAAQESLALLDASPADALGARYTSALAWARLEDEKAFDELDARFMRRGNTWSNLARALMLFKLGRTSAARRALRGFSELCQGSAYALLRPTYVEVYLPDRPEVAPNSFEEALLAVREAEPVIADVPDFIGWCQGFDWLVSSAQAFADSRDLDW